ncbi:MAG: ABC transporter substrate-binding protein [Symploca sp. SIO1C2]|nr:ABC transporter substrate-binding protein [Symploca sp. SIO1C2]
MLSDIKEVATILYELSDRFQQAQEEQSQNIAYFFEQIERCLLKSVKVLNNRQQPINEWGELAVYADNLPQILGNEIGDKEANRLSKKLKKTAKNVPQVGSDISEIKSLAGQFKGLAFIAKANLNNLAKSKSQPTRRGFLRYVPTVIGTAGGTVAGFTIGKSLPFTWNMTTFLRKELEGKSILYKAPKKVCDLVESMSDGQFKINLNREGGTTEILEAVSNGTIDCSYSGIYYDKDEYKALYFGSAIPFGLSPEEQNAWLFYKGEGNNDPDSLTYMQKVYERLGLNVIAFPAGGTGGQMGGWFKREVNSPGDFNGRKMRIIGFGEDILQNSEFKLDQPLDSASEPDKSADKIKENLENGTFEAAEWIGPHDDMQLGLHEARDIKFYYYPGWWEPSTTFDVQVNKDRWERLDKKYQDIFKAACYQTHLEILAEYNEKNSKALQKLKINYPNIEILRFTPEIMDAAKTATDNYLEKWGQGRESYHKVFRDVYRDWNKFKEDIREWSNYSNYTQIYQFISEFRSDICQEK